MTKKEKVISILTYALARLCQRDGGKLFIDMNDDIDGHVDFKFDKDTNYLNVTLVREGTTTESGGSGRAGQTVSA